MTTPRPIYLISCTKSKAATARPARELYAASDWFTKARDYVEGLGGDYRILSAEHGLLEPDAIVAPYETTLIGMRPDARLAWASLVWGKLGPMLYGDRPVIMLAGEDYREHLEIWITGAGREPAACVVPMRGLGLGQQKAWLAGQIRDRRALAVTDAMKVGKFGVQCQTADGRAWAYAALRFSIDDCRITKLLAKLDAAGAMIDPRHWRPIRALGTF